MLKALLAGAIIFAVMAGWIAVQNLARRFARRHPEWGPYREKVGCGGNCSCGNGGSCQRRES